MLDPESPYAVARLAPFWADVWEDGRAHWAVQCGLYTVTPDHRPLIDETPVPGLYVNTGYSGHGVMCSIAGGRLLVERMHGERTRSRSTGPSNRHGTRRDDRRLRPDPASARSRRCSRTPGSSC